MGKNKQRRESDHCHTAGQLMYAAEKIIGDAAAFVPHDRDNGAMIQKIHDMANQVRLLAGDVFWERFENLEGND